MLGPTVSISLNPGSGKEGSVYKNFGKRNTRKREEKRKSFKSVTLGRDEGRTRNPLRKKI